MSGTYQGTSYSLFLYGDTIIAGKKYNRLYVTYNNFEINQAINDSIFASTYDYDTSYFVCGIREDSTKKVWYSGLRNFAPFCYSLYYEGDTLEYLLYDFDMSIGDTIFYTNPQTYVYPGYLVLIDTSSQYFANNWRKIYHFYWDYTDWIEGIGGVEGILSPLMHQFEIFNNMLCYNGFHNTFTYTSYESLFGLPCPCNHTLDLNNTQLKPEYISNFYPNPSNGKITLRNRVDKIKVQTTSGQIVFESDKYNQSRLDLSHLRNGIYVFKYIRNGKTSVEKLGICK